jgi:hypothetical protein
MTNNSGRFLKGLMLGSSLIGLGYYLSKNKKFTDQLSGKYNDVLSVISDNSHDVQDKLMNTVKDTKSSLSESLDKKSKELTDLGGRLLTAFNAGRSAARESLGNSKTGTGRKNTLKAEPLKHTGEKPLGAIEDTSVDNTTNTLHPKSNNPGKNIGDAGTNFGKTTSGKTVDDVETTNLDKTTSGKTGSDRYGNDKFSGI